MSDIRGVTQVPGQGTGAVRDEAEDQPVMGHHDGEQVILEKDPVALAEEVLDTLGDELFSEEMEKELGREERRIGASEDAAAAAAEAAVEGEDAKPPGDALQRKAEIEKLGKELRQKGLTKPEDILKHVKENLGGKEGERGPNDDPTLQYGALTIIEEMYRAEGDEEMAKAVGAAAGQLLADKATEINKGMIVSEAAALYASERCGTVSDLRGLYMREVVGYQNIPAAFTAIMDKHGTDGFSDAVGFLVRAAGDDLAKMPATAERAQQKEVLDSLYQLEVLNTMRERADGALQQLGRSYPLAPEATPQRIMADMFGMIENPSRMSEPTVSKIAADAVPGPIEGRIAFLREYRTVATMVPVRVFDEADAGGGGLRLRQRLTDAIIAAQDAADTEEQQKLASQ